MPHPASWVLLTFGDRRSWSGNSGYEDDPTRLYRYDSFVPNHRQLKEGDIALVRSKEELLGIAQIAEIRQQPGTKERHRCPICRNSNFTKRKRTADSRCTEGHVFTVPTISFDACTKYEANFGDSFISVPDAVSIDDLRSAALRYNRQHAMQRIDLTRIADKLLRVDSAVRVLLPGGYIGSDGGVDELDAEFGEFEPIAGDRRREVLRAIRARRGQKKFRDRLRRRYGDACMISGCDLMDVVEAAHISPFRGDHDNHPANGLLLRADLHTLFDLDLLGITPDTLTVRLHPSVLSSGYADIDGVILRCVLRKPSRLGLEARWSSFLARYASATALERVGT